jgi:hypothetical protein
MYGTPQTPRSKRRCCGFSLYACLCCCCVLLLILIGVGVLLFFLLFRQPSFKVLGIQSTGNQIPIFQPDANTIGVNLTLNVQVDNPNVVGASLKQVLGYGQSPSLPGVDIAKGEIDDVQIAAKGSTTIAFPFTILYSEQVDKGQVALKDMIVKCGLTGQPKQQIPIKYRVDVKVSIIGIGIGLPEFSGSSQFDCPIPADFQNPLLNNLIAQMKASG